MWIPPDLDREDRIHRLMLVARGMHHRSAEPDWRTVTQFGELTESESMLSRWCDAQEVLAPELLHGAAQHSTARWIDIDEALAGIRNQDPFLSASKYASQRRRTQRGGVRHCRGPREIDRGSLTTTGSAFRRLPSAGRKRWVLGLGRIEIAVLEPRRARLIARLVRRRHSLYDHGKRHRHRSALPWRTHDEKLRPDHLGAVGHRPQPEAAGMIRGLIKTGAVVVHLDAQAAFLDLDAHGRSTGTAVLDHIVKGL